MIIDYEGFQLINHISFLEDNDAKDMIKIYENLSTWKKHDGLKITHWLDLYLIEILIEYESIVNERLNDFKAGYISG